jgi:transposase
MIAVPTGVRIWIATGHADMRKGMQGLSLLVQESLGRDPFAGDVFVFRGRAGSLMKARCGTTESDCRSMPSDVSIR